MNKASDRQAIFLWQVFMCLFAGLCAQLWRFFLWQNQHVSFFWTSVLVMETLANWDQILIVCMVQPGKLVKWCSWLADYHPFCKIQNFLGFVWGDGFTYKVSYYIFIWIGRNMKSSILFEKISKILDIFDYNY
jgi:hypothetical protein